MITAGLDLGSGSTKGVLLEDGREILASAALPTRGNPVERGREVLQRLAEEANLVPGQVAYLCTTGAARYAFEGRDLQVSDITASARGAILLDPRIRHVVDIGSQSSRAMSITETGRVLKFKMNEKCAAGAGRFVDRCAKYLQVPLDEMASKALGATHPKTISSVCAVLAETEIINNVAEEVPLADILMGVFLSLAQRAHVLMRYVGIQPEVALVGGLVQSPAMISALEKTVGRPVEALPMGQYAAALGAATLGHARLQKRSAVPAGAAS
jgi:predicted CoA-substrate-specific enzyme activase